MTRGQKLLEDDLVRMTNDLVSNRQSYANEVDLIDEAYVDRDQQVTSFRREGRRYSMSVKEDKTKAMLCSRKALDIGYIVMNELLLEVGEKYKYLTFLINHNNDLTSKNTNYNWSSVKM